MLFNSFDFIFFILSLYAVYLCVYAVTEKRMVSDRGMGDSIRELSPLWVLIAASLFFYSYWELSYFFLLTGSILTNYFVGSKIGNYILD